MLVCGYDLLPIRIGKVNSHRELTPTRRLIMVCVNLTNGASHSYSSGWQKVKGTTRISRLVPVLGIRHTTHKGTRHANTLGRITVH